MGRLGRLGGHLVLVGLDEPEVPMETPEEVGVFWGLEGEGVGVVWEGAAERPRAARRRARTSA